MDFLLVAFRGVVAAVEAAAVAGDGVLVRLDAAVVQVAVGADADVVLARVQAVHVFFPAEGEVGG